uniref:Uncharacterized protein n=1 Tax=Solanum tuberosum TaxID=4113 RepID=M1DLH2_SOLTU
MGHPLLPLINWSFVSHALYKIITHRKTPSRTVVHTTGREGGREPLGSILPSLGSLGPLAYAIPFALVLALLMLNQNLFGLLYYEGLGTGCLGLAPLPRALICLVNCTIARGAARGGVDSILPKAGSSHDHPDGS